jgi:hypothetical protein
VAEDLYEHLQLYRCKMVVAKRSNCETTMSQYLFEQYNAECKPYYRKGIFFMTEEQKGSYIINNNTISSSAKGYFYFNFSNYNLKVWGITFNSFSEVNVGLTTENGKEYFLLTSSGCIVKIFV